jgi:hypothetical protein
MLIRRDKLHVVLPALAITFIVGGASLAIAQTDSSGTDDEPQPWTEPSPGSVTYEAAANDPNGRAPWNVRVHQRRGTTELCLSAGQVRRGKFGVDRGKGFETRPEFTPNCSGLRTEPFALFLEQRSSQVGNDSGRTMVYGVVGPEVAAVSISGPSGTRQPRISPRGVFMTVYAGALDSLALDVSLRYVDGEVDDVKNGASRSGSGPRVP